MGTGGGAIQLDVDVKALVLIATFFRGEARAIDHAATGIFLVRGDVICAPAVFILDDSKGVGALGIAVIGAFAVGLPCPVNYDG